MSTQSSCKKKPTLLCAWNKVEEYGIIVLDKFINDHVFINKSKFEMSIIATYIISMKLILLLGLSMLIEYLNRRV